MTTTLTSVTEYSRKAYDATEYSPTHIAALTPGAHREWVARRRDLRTLAETDARVENVWRDHLPTCEVCA